MRVILRHEGTIEMFLGPRIAEKNPFLLDPRDLSFFRNYPRLNMVAETL
jgi:hypothetical protein